MELVLIFKTSISGMFMTTCWVLLIFVPSLFGFVACSTRGYGTDMSALIEFKSATRDDPSNVFGSWNGTTDFCQWRGVTCGSRHHRVTILDLRSMKLVGSIPPSIGNLSFLREIHLQGNNLAGEIPSEIGLLHRLEVLELYNNSLTGNIPPSLANCSSLSSISVAFNQLQGRIPEELGSLANLTFISLSANSLTGPIPTSFGNLSSLRRLSLSRNSLTGSIPNFQGRLRNIKGIALGVNNLTGPIPHSVFNLSTMTILDLGSNNFSGSLPEDLFATLPNLQVIILGFNRISGSIPTSISNASNLVQFSASVNLLTGAMPLLGMLRGLQILTISSNYLGTGRPHDMDFVSSMINATQLQRLDFHDNFFGGTFPDVVSNFSTSLIDLSIGNNRISGSIPSRIGNLVNLQGLDMWGNEISGTVPSNIGMLQQLVSLFLDSNRLSGNIPTSFENLTLLTDFRLGYNLLQGEIPSALGMLQNLNYLELSRNTLSGFIPKEIFSLTSLSIGLELSHNNLTGDLPIEVGNLKNLGALYVSDNKLSGNIPESLGSCISLEQVSLAGNNFYGNIPESISSLGSLELLDLSRNNLSGLIPQFLASWKFIQVLNLSYNHFEGEVPEVGVFKNATAVLIAGNDKLCGGFVELNLPKCETKPKRRRLAMKLVVSIVPSVIGVSLLALFLFLFLSKKKRNVRSSDSSEKPILALSYHCLVKATDGFSEERLIGAGAYGSVYKGIIDDGASETVIAVKVLNLLHRGANKSFQAECEALRNIRHRNLVKVLTACSGIDGNGNDFKAIVYEFMPNGSVESWLHPIVNEDAEGRMGEKQMRLSLLQRLNIAIDVACALDYVHHHCEVPLVHCDLKPSNILLDEEMVAHVADFGLARFIFGPKELHARQSSSIGIRGSTGYVPPEYGTGSEVSTSGDVYSFGILLLEMFTRKRPTDDQFDESMDLHAFAKKALPDNVKDIADPTLVEEIHRAVKPVKTMDCLVSVLNIGIVCSTKSPKERMDISSVLAELTNLRNILIPKRKRHLSVEGREEV